MRNYILIILFMTGASAMAGSVSLSVEGTANYALKHNPSLSAARLRIEEARGRLQHSGRLSNPELELDFTRHTAGPEGSFGVALTQRFPLTARLRHEKAVSRAELAAAEAEVRDAERRITAEASAAAVKLLALGRQRDLRTKQLAASRELFEFLQERVKVGETSPVDASQVELETRQIEVESLMLAADEALLLGELRPLLGVAGDARVSITGGLSAPKGVPAVRTVTDRADILAAQSRADAARSAVLEQRSRRWEDFGMSAGYSRERTLDVPEPVETEQIIGLRFSLPLPIWNNNAGRIREAEAAAMRAQKEVDNTRIEANAEAATARDAMGSYAKLLGEIDGKVLPAATQIEEQLRQSYATGQSALIDVLRARTRLLELQRQRLDALRDYHLARIRHAAAVGQFSQRGALKTPPAVENRRSK